MLNNIAALLDAGVAASTNSYESIATTTLSSSQTTITFSSIPSTYKHLQIRSIARANTGNAGPGVYYVGFNGDTTYTNYFGHEIYGTGATAAAGYYASSTNALGAPATLYSGNTALSDTFGAGVVDILDYTNTNKNTTIRSLGGADYNGTGGFVEFISGCWSSTAAVTSISITAFASVAFLAKSQFALYGIKG